MLLPILVYAALQETNLLQKASKAPSVIVANGNFEGGSYKVVIPIEDIGGTCPAKPETLGVSTNTLEIDSLGKGAKSEQVLGESTGPVPVSFCDSLRKYYCYEDPLKKGCNVENLKGYYARTPDAKTPCTESTTCCKPPSGVTYDDNIVNGNTESGDGPSADTNTPIVDGTGGTSATGSEIPTSATPDVSVPMAVSPQAQVAPSPVSTCDTLRKYYCFEGQSCNVEELSGYYARTPDAKTPCAEGTVCCKPLKGITYDDNIVNGNTESEDRTPADANTPPDTSVPQAQGGIAPIEEATTCNYGEIADGWERVGPKNTYQKFEVVSDKKAEGQKSQKVVTASKGIGISQVIKGLGKDKTYKISAKIYVEKGQTTMVLRDEKKNVDIVSSKRKNNGKWQSINLKLDSPSDSGGLQLEIKSQTDNSVFYIDKIRLTEETEASKIEYKPRRHSDFDGPENATEQLATLYAGELSAQYSGFIPTQKRSVRPVLVLHQDFYEQSEFRSQKEIQRDINVLSRAIKEYIQQSEGFYKKFINGFDLDIKDTIVIQYPYSLATCAQQNATTLDNCRRLMFDDEREGNIYDYTQSYAGNSDELTVVFAPLVAGRYAFTFVSEGGIFIVGNWVPGYDKINWFNSKFHDAKWYDDDWTKKIITHELGHSFGLSHSDYNSVMSYEVDVLDEATLFNTRIFPESYVACNAPLNIGQHDCADLENDTSLNLVYSEVKVGLNCRENEPIPPDILQKSQIYLAYWDTIPESPSNPLIPDGMTELKLNGDTYSSVVALDYSGRRYWYEYESDGLKTRVSKVFKYLYADGGLQQCNEPGNYCRDMVKDDFDILNCSSYLGGVSFQLKLTCGLEQNISSTSGPVSIHYLNDARVEDMQLTEDNIYSVQNIPVLPLYPNMSIYVGNPAQEFNVFVNKPSELVIKNEDLHATGTYNAVDEPIDLNLGNCSRDQLSDDSENTEMRIVADLFCIDKKGSYNFYNTGLWSLKIAKSIGSLNNAPEAFSAMYATNYIINNFEPGKYFFLSTMYDGSPNLKVFFKRVMETEIRKNGSVHVLSGGEGYYNHDNVRIKLPTPCYMPNDFNRLYVAGKFTCPGGIEPSSMGLKGHYVISFFNDITNEYEPINSRMSTEMQSYLPLNKKLRYRLNLELYDSNFNILNEGVDSYDFTVKEGKNDGDYYLDFKQNGVSYNSYAPTNVHPEFTSCNYNDKNSCNERSSFINKTKKFLNIGEKSTSDCKPLLKPTVDITSSLPKIPLGSFVNLKWESENAVFCKASNAWSGNLETLGTKVVVPTLDANTFTLTCTGPGGSASDSVTINVEESPKTTLGGTLSCQFTPTPSGGAHIDLNDSSGVVGTAVVNAQGNNTPVNYSINIDNVDIFDGRLYNLRPREFDPNTGGTYECLQADPDHPGKLKAARNTTTGCDSGTWQNNISPLQLNFTATSCDRSVAGGVDQLCDKEPLQNYLNQTDANPPQIGDPYIEQVGDYVQVCVPGTVREGDNTGKGGFLIYVDKNIEFLEHTGDNKAAINPDYITSQSRGGNGYILRNIPGRGQMICTRISPKTYEKTTRNGTKAPNSIKASDIENGLHTFNVFPDIGSGSARQKTSCQTSGSFDVSTHPNPPSTPDVPTGSISVSPTEKTVSSGACSYDVNFNWQNLKNEPRIAWQQNNGSEIDWCGGSSPANCANWGQTAKGFAPGGKHRVYRLYDGNTLLAGGPNDTNATFTCNVPAQCTPRDIYDQKLTILYGWTTTPESRAKINFKYKGFDTQSTRFILYRYVNGNKDSQPIWVDPNQSLNYEYIDQRSVPHSSTIKYSITPLHTKDSSNITFCDAPGSINAFGDEYTEEKDVYDAQIVIQSVEGGTVCRLKGVAKDQDEESTPVRITVFDGKPGNLETTVIAYRKQTAQDGKFDIQLNGQIKDGKQHQLYVNALNNKNTKGSNRLAWNPESNSNVFEINCNTNGGIVVGGTQIFAQKIYQRILTIIEKIEMIGKAYTTDSEGIVPLSETDYEGMKSQSEGTIEHPEKYSEISSMDEIITLSQEKPQGTILYLKIPEDVYRVAFQTAYSAYIKALSPSAGPAGLLVEPSDIEFTGYNNIFSTVHATGSWVACPIWLNYYHTIDEQKQELGVKITSGKQNCIPGWDDIPPDWLDPGKYINYIIFNAWYNYTPYIGFIDAQNDADYLYLTLKVRYQTRNSDVKIEKRVTSGQKDAQYCSKNWESLSKSINIPLFGGAKSVSYCYKVTNTGSSINGWHLTVNSFRDDYINVKSPRDDRNQVDGCVNENMIPAPINWIIKAQQSIYCNIKLDKLNRDTRINGSNVKVDAIDAGGYESSSEDKAYVNGPDIKY